MEQNSDVVSFGPVLAGAEGDDDSIETEANGSLTHSDHNLSRDHHQDDRNDRGYETIANVISRQMESLNENIRDGFNIMQTQMRNLLGTVNDKLENVQEIVNANSSRNSRVDNVEVRPEIQDIPVIASSTPYHDRNENNIHGDVLPRNNGTHKMKPQNFSGNEDLEDYLTQFDLISDLNNWDHKTKSLYLASSLTGEARGLLNELSPADRKDYAKIVNILTIRFGSENKAEVFRSELQTRTKRRDESLPELAQSIKKLTRKAYPSASSNVIETLALDYFIDAIPFREVRIRLREVNPKTLSEAEKIAVRLDAVHVSDKNRNRNVNVKAIDTEDNKDSKVLDRLEKLDKKLENVSTEVKSMQHQSSKMQGNYRQTGQNNNSRFGQTNRNFNNYKGSNYKSNDRKPFYNNGQNRSFQENQNKSTSGGEARQQNLVPRQ